MGLAALATAGIPRQFGPTTVAAASMRASGLPFDSGVFAQQSGPQANVFASMRGAPLDVITVYADVSSKAHASKVWWDAATPRDFNGTLAIGVPLWTKDSSIEDASGGGMDAVWTAIAHGLVSHGYVNAYIRLAWEMNIHSDSMAGIATASNRYSWSDAYRRAARVFKGVSSGFRIVFNPNLGPSQTGVEADVLYPGDEYVDVVGIDAYDWWPAYDSDQNWHKHLHEAYGWDYWMQFARRHGKQFALCEWGVAPANPNSGGDNERYIGYVYSYLRANADVVAYESYFEEPADFCRSALALNPRARGAYQWWISQLRR